MLYGSAGGRPGLVLAVDEQAPDLLERDPPDDLLDVDAAVAQRGAFLVRLGDLRLERDDTLEPVMYLSHAWHSARSRPGSRRVQRCVHLGSASVTVSPRPRAGCYPVRWTPIPSAGRAAPRVRRRGARRAGPGRRPGRDVPPLARRHRRRAGVHEPNAMVVTTGLGRAAGRPRGWCCSRPSTSAGSSSTPTTTRARATSWTPSPPSALLFPWHDLQRQVRVEGSRRAGLRRGERGLLRQPPARLAARRLGLAAVAARWPRARTSSGVRRGGGALRRLRRARCPPHWGGFRVVPGRRWSSGRAARAGCTTGWSTAGRGRAGRSCGWRPDCLVKTSL